MPRPSFRWTIPLVACTLAVVASSPLLGQEPTQDDRRAEGGRDGDSSAGRDPRDESWRPTQVLDASGSLILRPQSAPVGLPENLKKVYEGLEEEGELLTLTLRECVLGALSNNLGVRADQLGVDIARAAEEVERAVFDPVFSAGYSDTSTESPTGTRLGGADVQVTDSRSLDFGLSQLLPTGTTLRLDYSQSRLSTNSVFATLNPVYSNGITASITQPLLKGGWLAFNESALRIAQNNSDLSSEQYRLAAEELVLSVFTAYWDLVFALEDVIVKEDSLRLAEREQEITQNRIDTGVLAERDIYFSKASVAQRKSDLVAARAIAQNASDGLKRLILPIDGTRGWSFRVAPADRPLSVPEWTIPTWEEAVQVAYESRADVRQGRIEIENRRISVAAAENQSLPQVDLFGSIGYQGLDDNVDDAISDIGTTDFEAWTLGVLVEIPWGLRAGRNQLLIRRLELRQALLRQQDLRSQVARDVREALRAVIAAWEVIQHRTEGTVYAQNQLEAEEEKYRVGTTTQYQVLQVQNDLATARRDENTSRKDYRVALARLAFAQGILLESEELGILANPGE